MKEHFRDSDRCFWQCRLTDATVGCQVLAALEKRQFRNVSAGLGDGIGEASDLLSQLWLFRKRRFPPVGNWGLDL